MRNKNFMGSNSQGDGDRMQLVEELELAKRSSPQAVRRVVNTPVAIEVRPADSMLRDQILAVGKTGELSVHSVSAELSKPVAIGGFYCLDFEESDLDLTTQFARCDQISMIAEDRFVVRFRFLTPIILARSTATQEPSNAS
tara:strand:- start:48028 stop:48450 length:423 start_codon:yes stop_codon:yes gene_type:complete